jgi:hypothetical protein
MQKGRGVARSASDPREVSDTFEGALRLLRNFDFQELLRAKAARSSASMIARNCTTGRSELYS